MGIIIGKFRKKKSTYEVLEKLENEITSIEEFGRSTEQFRKKVITRFILLAVLIYFILACLLYLYYNNISTNQKLIYVVPLVAFPFVIFIIKKFLAWYYTKKLQRNEKKLVKLKEEKKKIIDNVMETETYKVAKKILDKFGNEGKKPVTEVGQPTNLMARNNQTGLRQRNWGASQGPNSRLSFGTPRTPKLGEKPFLDPRSLAMDKPFPQPTPMLTSSRTGYALTPKLGPGTPRVGPVAFAAGTPMPLPRNILPNNRSVLDKMVDYLIGDGPSNRFALICKKCSCHNGMALKEEFEYISFRCCYCSHFNNARKKKPTGPKFEAHQPLKITAVEDSSESDKETQDSESELQQPANSDARRSSSEADMPKPISPKTRTSSDVQVPKKSPHETRNSTPEVEKYSDFDKLSDLESREGEHIDKSPEDSGVPQESGDGTNLTLETADAVSDTVEAEESPESPMEIDQEKSTTELNDINES